MKNLIITLLLFIIGFGSISAKKDYKNPVKTENLIYFNIVLPDKKVLPKVLVLNVDRYNNYYLTVNMMGHDKNENPRGNDILLKVNDSIYTVKFKKRIMVYDHSTYEQVYSPSLVTTTSIYGFSSYSRTYIDDGKRKFDYKRAYCIYPISKEFADLIKDKKSIKEITVLGIHYYVK